MDHLWTPPQYNRNVARRGANLVAGSKTPSAFTNPLSLPNLGAWWDFSQSGTLTLSGSDITTIADVNGSGRNPVGPGGQRPDNLSTINSLVAGHFVSNDYMQYNIPDVSQPFTQWVVLKLDAAHAGNKTYFGDPVSGTQSCLFSETSTFKLSTFGGAVLSTGVATDTNAHLFIGVFNGASSRWYLDGSSGTGTLSASTFATVNLGAWLTNGDLLIGECGYTTDAMTAGDAASMRTYSQAKWATG